MVEQYNEDIEEYELLLRGRTVIKDLTEYEKLSNMNNELESKSLELEQESLYLDEEFNRLGRYKWFPFGIVQSVEIYW